MRIVFLCSDPDHPVNAYLKEWIHCNSDKHQISLVRKKCDLPDGDFLFLVSCSEIINSKDRSKFKHTLVLHASDLPKGRGWSPHVWNILEGATQITLSLLEAEDRVDSGRIWKKKTIDIPKHALWNEINEALFEAEIELIDFAVNNHSKVSPKVQDLNVEPTYYPKRTPEDSKINADLTLRSQFDLIRVCDPCRYPAIIEIYGKKFKI